MLKWNARLTSTTANLDAQQGEYPNSHELKNLARRAVDHGMTLQIVTTPTRTDHFVYDPRDGSEHYVTAVSCDCRQFIGSGSAGCQHLALLQVEKGWIPEAVVEPELAVAS